VCYRSIARLQRLNSAFFEISSLFVHLVKNSVVESLIFEFQLVDEFPQVFVFVLHPIYYIFPT
jgi:hypothetical protein